MTEEREWQGAGERARWVWLALGLVLAGGAAAILRPSGSERAAPPRPSPRAAVREIRVPPIGDRPPLLLVTDGAAAGATDFAVMHEALWAVTGSGVARIDLRTGKATGRVAIPGSSRVRRLAAGAPFLADSTAGTVTLFDPESLGVVESFPAGSPAAVAADDSGSVWIADAVEGVVLELRRPSARLDRWDAGGVPIDMATAVEQGCWLATTRGIWRLEQGAAPRLVKGDYTVTPRAIAVGGGEVWVATPGEVHGIDPETGHVRSRIRVDALDLWANGRLLFILAAEGPSVVAVDIADGVAFSRVRTVAGARYLGGEADRAWVLDPSDGRIAVIE